MRLPILAAALMLSANIVAAQTSPASQPSAASQSPGPVPVLTVSSAAATAVHFDNRDGKIAITYGQPHARGRVIMGNVVPYGQVWRLGANPATILHTDVDISIGGTRIPAGEYSLFALPNKDSWQLIVNKQTGQWGTDYDSTKDFVRIPLHVGTLPGAIESLTIYLIPAATPDGTADADPHGVLKIVWEKTELTTDWKVLAAK